MVAVERWWLLGSSAIWVGTKHGPLNLDPLLDPIWTTFWTPFCPPSGPAFFPFFEWLTSQVFLTSKVQENEQEWTNSGSIGPKNNNLMNKNKKVKVLNFSALKLCYHLLTLPITSFCLLWKWRLLRFIRYLIKMSGVGYHINIIWKNSLQFAFRHYYNLCKLTNITKCCNSYYKMRKLDLLQNASLLQNAAEHL